MVTHRSITNVFFPALNSANEFLSQGDQHPLTNKGLWKRTDQFGL